MDDPVTPITPEPNRAVYILHNSLPFSSGGYATRSHGIASGLKLAGYEVIMLTRPGFPLDINTSLSLSDIPAEESVDGIRYERVLEPKRSTSISRDGLPADEYLVAAADALTERLRALRPSVVIAASNYQTALPAMLAARRLGLPFVYEVRGFWEVTRISRQPEFAKTIAYAVDRAMEGGLAARADQVFTLTEAMRDELIDRGVEAEKIVLLPNSCDPTRFHPGERDAALAKRLNIPPNVPVIGYIGTFVHYEGLEDLAGACAQLKEQNIEFRLLMVGNEDVSGTGVGPITQAVRDIAEKAGFSKWLIMPGRIPHSEVESHYSLIDIAPFPRKPLPVCEMVSPMKPLEAMAMKKAVLVSSVRALSEMVEHEQTGLIFEKGNVADFSRQLRLLIEQPELRKRLGENGRVWVEQERTWLKTGGKAHDVIEAQVLHPKYPIHAVRSDGAHIVELARFQTLLTRAFGTGEENRVVPVSETKTLYFLHSSLPHLSGGYATRAHGIVKGTLAAGFDITPYTRPGFPVDTREIGPDETFDDADVVDGISYHRIFGGANRGAVSEIEYMLSMIDEFERVLRQERPALVHGRSTYLTALPALIAARRAGLPFVYEVSGLWELVHASRDKTGALQHLIDRIRDLETFTILNADRVITLTEGMVDELVSRGADREKIHLIPNSVSPEQFVPIPRDDALAEKLGIPPGVPVMGYVGTFVDYEGLDDLIRAAKRILARGIDCRVLLVGDGRGQQNHKALARQLGDKLILPGRVPHDVVKNYYSLIDVLVYARKPWQVCETVSPMKPFEALALEKAVVASSVRALSQIILDGETGLIFEKGDPDSLADKVVSLFESPELRTALGKKGREWVIENRTWTTAGEEVAQVYRRTLAPS
nr:glycosyltransferase family 4 protein [Bordetella sp. BOR01]